MSDHRSVRWFLLSLCLSPLLLLSGCYSGSRPSRIGSIAPDFTVQDFDRKVTLRQFRGNGGPGIARMGAMGSCC